MPEQATSPTDFPLPEKARGSRWGYYNRVNRVTQYQRLFQQHDGLRQWQKTPKSKYFVLPFKVTMYTTFAGVMWMMGRMVLGHRTWWGKG